MAALASLDDVNRILGYTTGADPTRDAKIRAALDAVESWAEAAIKVPPEGSNVEVYWDVGDDATLYLPAPDITVTKVKIIPNSMGGDDSFFWLYVNSLSSTGQGFDLDDQGRLMLRPGRVYNIFDDAYVSSLRRQYDRVEVHYEGTGIVPRAITEGIAFLAAGYHRYGPQALQNIKSEKIGDYSYTLGGAGSGSGDEDLPYLKQADFFLRRFMRKQRVQVV